MLGANVYLGVLFVLATITLVMPDYTRTTAGPVYSAAPLGFVPAVAAAYALDKRLVLAPPQSLVLLFLTFALSMLTFGAGRTNVLFGLVHMVVFAVFLFMLFIP